MIIHVIIWEVLVRTTAVLSTFIANFVGFEVLIVEYFKGRMQVL